MTLDAKMGFDDNADFRQKELFAYRDLTQQDEKEVEALKYNLNYIALDGKWRKDFCLSVIREKRGIPQVGERREKIWEF